MTVENLHKKGKLMHKNIHSSPLLLLPKLQQETRNTNQIKTSNFVIENSNDRPYKQLTSKEID